MRLLFIAILLAGVRSRPTWAEPPDIERFLRIRSATGPTVSPNGDTLAYLSNQTGSYQIWAVPATGGPPTQWTRFDDRVSFVRWSPTDPNTLVFGRDAGGNERIQLYRIRPGGQDVQPLTEDAKAVFAFGDFSPDGLWISYSSNQRDARFFDVYVLELATRRVRCAYQHDGSNYARGFSPDGRKLLVQRRHDNADQELVVVDLDSGTADNVTPARPAKYEDAHWDVGGLRYLTDANAEFLRLERLDLSTRTTTKLADLDRDIDGLDRFPARSVNDGGYSRLFVERQSDRPTAVELPFAGLVGSLRSGGGRLAVTLSGPTHTSDVWLLESDNTLRRLTQSDTAGFAPEDFAAPETVRFRSFDGLEIPAFFTRPKAARKDGTLPVVIDIHGGPESQRRPGFSPVTQYLVARGFAVLEPNVRGSTGYGKRYEHLDDVRRRMDSVRDIRAAVDWLKANGWADPRKIALLGGSYGGFMVLACLTEYPDDFAAGVDFFGIANFETFLANTGPYRRKQREAEYGSLDTDREFLRAISPIHRVERIRAPLLVVQGANDPRVPKSESDQMVAALRARHHPVEYLVFDDEGHGLAKLTNRIRAYRAVAEFLNRHAAGAN